MSHPIPMHIIARIRSDFPTKFGIPRQSGLADTPARIEFEPPYRNADALRGIDGFSHLWLIWQFSEAVREGWSPTVRPPKLGGNRRVGVFATRSPFRPNAIGLSSVRLERVEPWTPDGPILHVSGADLMDGTPVITGTAIDGKGAKSTFTAIPYYAFGNRGNGGYRVWLPTR